MSLSASDSRKCSFSSQLIPFTPVCVRFHLYVDMTLAELTSSLQLTSSYLMSDTIITKLPAGGWGKGLACFQNQDFRSQ